METLLVILLGASGICAAGLCFSIMTRPSEEEEFAEAQQRVRPVEGFSDDPWVKSTVSSEEAAANLSRLKKNRYPDAHPHTDEDSFVGELIITGALDAINQHGPVLSKTSFAPLKFMVVDVEAEIMHFASSVVSTSGFQLKGALSGEFVPSTTLFKADMKKHHSEKFTIELDETMTGFEAKGLLPEFGDRLIDNLWKSPLAKILTTGLDLSEIEIEFDGQYFALQLRGLSATPELLKPVLLIFMEMTLTLSKILKTD